MLPIVLTAEEKIHLYKLAIDARVKIERFNALLERSIINQEVLMSFSLQEAIQSTRIEGTQTTFNKVLESNITGEQGTAEREVSNYLEALAVGKERLRHLPISTRLFLELHSILLNDSRGGNRPPGEYRKIQNFIGPTSDIKDATYISPEPQLINKYMSNLEEYINGEIVNDLDPLIRAGIIHGQFETIHPFLDGNGRMGRLLITLLLCEQKALSKPLLYISHYFKLNRLEYYDRLMNIRTKGDWEGWLKFFLKGVILVANQAVSTSRKIVNLQSTHRQLVSERIISAHSYNLLEYLFQRPIINTKKAAQALGISFATASRLITLFCENSILEEMTGKNRNRVYVYKSYLDILNADFLTDEEEY